MRWDFFVRHYADARQQARDPQVSRDGTTASRSTACLYPRAATLGGCTAHNAMILVYPHNADWNQLADLTGDPSWRAERHAHVLRAHRALRAPADERARADSAPIPVGTAGRAGCRPRRPSRDAVFKRPRPAEDDPRVGEGGVAAVPRLRSPTPIDAPGSTASSIPTTGASSPMTPIGLRYTPLTTRRPPPRRLARARAGRGGAASRSAEDPCCNALATRVLFDDTDRAIGVEYLDGERLYGAHPRPEPAPADTTRQVFAAREVILAGGAFNTPQLLMLSGIGPKAALDAHGIPVRVALDGVGKNLQDRYEVAVVNRMNFPAWKALEGATFTHEDRAVPGLGRRPRRRVHHATARSCRSSRGPARARRLAGPVPLRAARPLRGYFPGYSSLLAKNPNCLTWVVLKAHTNNTAARSRCAVADPRGAAAHQLPLLRGRQRRRRRRSRGSRQPASAWPASWRPA